MITDDTETVPRGHWEINTAFTIERTADGRLFGAPLDVDKWKLGPASPIAEAVRFGPAYPGKLGISRTGSVAYVGGRLRLRELVIAEPAQNCRMQTRPNSKV